VLDVDALIAMGVLVASKKSWLLHLHVQPGAKRTEAMGLHGDRLKVRLHAPPVDGKANKALIAWLAKELRCAKADITLIRGQTSRQKTLRINAALGQGRTD